MIKYIVSQRPGCFANVSDANFISNGYHEKVKCVLNILVPAPKIAQFTPMQTM